MERLLQLTLSGSALALLLMLLRRLLGKRLPSTVVYYAWLLVLLRFLLPLPGLVPVAAQIAPTQGVHEARPAVVAETIEAPKEEAAPAQGLPVLPLPKAEPAEALPAEALPLEAETSAPARAAKPLWPLLWALGAGLSFGFSLVSYALYTLRLRRTLRRPDAFTRAVYEALDGRKPALWCSGRVKTPLTYGLLFPKIVLPAGHYDEPTLQNVFRHELTHVRRMDALYKWFAAAVLSLHWFNPLSWLIRRAIDRDCELSCDEALLRSMDRAGKRAYGETLLDLAASGALPAGVVATTFATEKKNLKERLEQIMNYKKSGARVLAAVLALLLLAGCGAAAGPATTPAAAPAGAEAPAAPETTDRVRVTNMDELLAALAPNTTVELAAGDYALSSASNYGKPSNSGCYVWVEAYDGYELQIRNLENLVLLGEGAEKVTLTAEPRYANVLTFSHCKNVLVSGLTAGHTKEPGLCSGGVLRFEGCSDCSVRDCGLFGCGTIGVWAADCAGLYVENCAVYECSYSALSVYDCLDVSFTGGEVYGCGTREGTGAASSLFETTNSQNVSISGVKVHDNRSRLLLSSTGTRGLLFLSNEVRDNELDGAFALERYGAVVDGCLFQANGDFACYLFPLGPVASDLTGAALDEEALRSMTLRAIDPASAALAVAQPEADDVPAGSELRVNTVDEFLAAIGPQRTIVLDGELFDLSTAFNYGAGSGAWYYWEQTYDGPELVIEGVDGLCIRAASDEPKATTLAAVPRYANVLSFRSCEDLTLVGFTAGHTQEPGTCAGGVLHFADCHGITVEACRLYGCGILGLQCETCTSFQARRTEIYDCSLGAVNMSYTDGIDFIDCDVHDVPDPAFLFSYCGDVSWNGEPLTLEAYDLLDGEPVPPGRLTVSFAEDGVLRMSIEQYDAMAPDEERYPLAEVSAELAFAKEAQQLIADGDWNELAGLMHFPLVIFTDAANYRVESREEFLAGDLAAVLPKSFRERVGAAALDDMGVSLLGNTVADDCIVFAHEDVDNADAIRIQALLVRGGGDAAAENEREAVLRTWVERLQRTELTLKLGESVELYADGPYSDSAAIVWTSSDEGALTVKPDPGDPSRATLTAVGESAEGVTVTAAFDGVEASVTVYIVP